jgi:hypothetical protein
VQLDEEVIRRAKALAARRGMSVSGLVTQQIAELTAADERYQRARESALLMMERARDRGGRPPCCRARTRCSPKTFRMVGGSVC